MRIRDKKWLALALCVSMAVAGCGSDAETSTEQPTKEEGTIGEQVNNQAEATETPAPTSEPEAPTAAPEVTEEPTPAPTEAPAQEVVSEPIGEETQPLVREWTESELAVADVLKDKGTGDVVWISCHDFDGDGKEEAFAIKGGPDDMWGDGVMREDGSYDYYYGTMWYVADGEATMLIDPEDYDLGLAKPVHMRVGNKNYIVTERLYASASASYVYYVENGLQEVYLNRPMGFEQMKNGMFSALESSYDASTMDGIDVGHTYKPYYFYYEDGKFCEYAGVPVNEDVFAQYINGDAILQTIRQNYRATVDSIYYYDYSFAGDYGMSGDGSYMYVNYSMPGEGNEQDINHFYFRVPVIYLPEGPMLSWDVSQGLEQVETDFGIYHELRSDANAVYPAFRTPAEYYAEQYAGMKPENLEIRVKQFDQDNVGEVVLNGSSIKAISDKDAVFTLSDEFVIAAKQRMADSGIDIGDAGIYEWLGVDGGSTSAEIWIGEERIALDSIAYYGCPAYSSLAMVGNSWSARGMEPVDNDVKLVYYDGGENGVALAKIAGFAAATGLAKKAEPIRIDQLNEYGAYHAFTEYQIDLNGDGQQDSVYFGGRKLLINGRNYFGMIEKMYHEDVEGDVFFLWDLNKQDNTVEIGIWTHGPSDDDMTYIYSYSKEDPMRFGEKHLTECGYVEGPYGYTHEDIIFDGNGGITYTGRFAILQTWWGIKKAKLNENYILEPVTEGLYEVVDNAKDNVYKLLKSVKLYENADLTGNTSILKPQDIYMVATNNEDCVKVVTCDGSITGYIHVVDYGCIELADGTISGWADEVMEGLCFAD